MKWILFLNRLPDPGQTVVVRSGPRIDPEYPNSKQIDMSIVVFGVERSWPYGLPVGATHWWPIPRMNEVDPLSDLRLRSPSLADSCDLFASKLRKHAPLIDWVVMPREDIFGFEIEASLDVGSETLHVRQQISEFVMKDAHVGWLDWFVSGIANDLANWLVKP